MKQGFLRCGAACLLACALPALGQGSDAPRYSIKREDADTGSHIQRSSVRRIPIPPDKPFAQLTPSEQATWKAQYEALGPNDQPPFPVDGLKNIYQAVEVVHQKYRLSGPMSLFARIDEKGQATSVSVLVSSDAQAARHIGTILMLEKYTPGLCNGTPCAMDFPFRMSFFWY